jgi:hypothetical protein
MSGHQTPCDNLPALIDGDSSPVNRVSSLVRQDRVISGLGGRQGRDLDE